MRSTQLNIGNSIFWSQSYSVYKNFISLFSHWFSTSESLLEWLWISIALFLGITCCNWQHIFSQALDKGSLLKQKCIFTMYSTFGLSCKITRLKKCKLEPAPTNLMTVIRIDSLVAQESQDRASNDLQHKVIVLCQANTFILRIWDTVLWTWQEMTISNQNKSIM